MNKFIINLVILKIEYPTLPYPTLPSPTQRIDFLYSNQSTIVYNLIAYHPIVGTRICSINFELITSFIHVLIFTHSLYSICPCCIHIKGELSSFAITQWFHYYNVTDYFNFFLFSFLFLG